MKKTKATPAALGFRVKSGWAMAVLLAYADNFPTLIRCVPALLSDPQFPATKQPYHAALELPPEMRAMLAEHLLLSLDGPNQKQIDDAWAEEAERRMREIDEGTVEAIDGELVMQRIRSRRRLQN